MRRTLFACLSLEFFLFCFEITHGCRSTAHCFSPPRTSRLLLRSFLNVKFREFWGKVLVLRLAASWPNKWMDGVGRSKYAWDFR
ncbi:hypothetical protein F4782DRAFT_328974 [Xylaria castorea]|nr:hypothetical protein F4782DRAFT_328974 [Xylaria castorea]